MPSMLNLEQSLMPQHNNLLCYFVGEQTDYSGGQNPHGLADGWTWCARLLNHIPSNRSSASALEAFLKVCAAFNVIIFLLFYVLWLPYSSTVTLVFMLLRSENQPCGIQCELFSKFVICSDLGLFVTRWQAFVCIKCTQSHS
jgi:hypothetical protein